MSMLDDMLSEITDRGNKKGSVFELSEGQSATIRFITDADEVQRIIIHSRYVQGKKGVGYIIPCPLSYGHKKCELEGRDDRYSGGNRDSKNNFLFVVYDYRDSKIKTMCYKANMCSPLERIGNYFNDVGTLLGRDFTISRNSAKGTETRYSMKAGKASNMSDDMLNMIDSTFPEKSKLAYWKFERDAIAQSYHPQLLKPGEFSLPQIVLEDVENLPEGEEDDMEKSFTKKTKSKDDDFVQTSKKSKHSAEKLDNKYGEIVVDDDEDMLLGDL